MKRALYLLAIPVLAVLAACGSSDEPSSAAGPDDARVIEVEMRDIIFAPTTVDVRVGEKVRFVFKNVGQIVHDAFIGDQAAQDEHEKKTRGGHGDHGQGSDAVSVKPGKTAQLVHTFDRAGQIFIGCHQPGHYTGGMKATVNIA